MTMTRQRTDDDLPRWVTGDGPDDDIGLDAAFSDLRDARPVPDAEFMARLHTSAAAALSSAAPSLTSAVTPFRQNSAPLRHGRSAGDPRAAPRRTPRPWQGRGGALAGLMAAGVAGLWIGVAAPAPVLTVGAAMGLDLGTATAADQVPLDLSQSDWAMLETIGDG